MLDKFYVGIIFVMCCIIWLGITCVIRE